ncbi:MAG: acetyl-CoA carboxylase carboxyltransferase subunit alpha [Alphaproteobacteria bacterium]
MQVFLDFEKPIAELENRIEELSRLNKSGSSKKSLDMTSELKRLQAKTQRLLKETYQTLSPWQKVQVARHPNRPHMKCIVKHLIQDFVPLAGDRNFGEDHAIIGGLGTFRGRSVVVIGTEKGYETNERLLHNFGMARPEGYRKAQRLMKLADKFNLPLLTFVDTPGAYPGVGAEQRGQAEAIAKSTEICLKIKVPFVSTIVGEGGSGGAIALATANKVLMLEHSVYSVISPEGCASILWRSADFSKDAAEALKLTAADLLKLGIIDKIVPEPLGGAHRDQKKTLDTLGNEIEKALNSMNGLNGEQLLHRRRQKFLDIGRNIIE